MKEVVREPVRKKPQMEKGKKERGLAY